MKVRMPAELKESIKAASDESGLSMNGEIVRRLEHSFESGARLSKLTSSLIADLLPAIKDSESLKACQELLDAEKKRDDALMKVWDNIVRINSGKEPSKEGLLLHKLARAFGIRG